MAVVGDTLIAPESGWKRVDASPEFLEFQGEWIHLDVAGTYNNTLARTQGNHIEGVVKFRFDGTKLRIISLRHNASYSSSARVFIDDIPVGVINLNGGSNEFQKLVFEIQGLEDKTHNVTIKNERSIFFNIDAVDIDSESNITLPIIKFIIKNPITNQHYSLADKTLITLPDASSKNIILHGIEAGKEIRLDGIFDKIRSIFDNEDGTQTFTEEIVDPFSIYDLFGVELEVIYYTDDESVTEANLILETNWSPIDELDGNFEVVTWTDELNSSKKLELNAIPSPQLIHTTTLSNVTGELKNIISSDLSTVANSNVRYLLTKDNVNWLKWNGTDFVNVLFTNKKDILNIGMTYGEIMTISDWSKWSSNKINIGVYLQDDDTTASKVGNLGFVENSSNKSTKLSNVNFYILNTTAKIELDLQGLLLSGHLSDLDSTRVQYKVTLNGQPYYPLSGDYTSLSPSPQNIEIAFKSSEIKMNDWNTLRVDFKDYFGTEDYWQTTFVGNYSALMFMDVDGNYYSDDIGKVLQYLDFGTIVAGEVTVAHEVVIKNQYGYAVKDLQLEASRSNLPEGVDIQLSKVNDSFEPEQSLLFEDGLNFEDQTSFYVRMVTDVDSVPNDTKSFNIFVKASRKGV